MALRCQILSCLSPDAKDDKISRFHGKKGWWGVQDRQEGKVQWHVIFSLF